MSWQFDDGTKDFLKVVTNPWLPNCDNNKILIYLNDEVAPSEISVNAEKSLYTYQIDLANMQIMNKGMNDFNEKNFIG